MKDEAEVRLRVRELVTAELKRRLDESNERLPHRCTHNYRHVLDTRKVLVGEPNEKYNRIGDVRHLPLSQSMGLCMLGAEDPEQWKGDLCDEPIDAQRCPYFNPLKDDQKITAEFATHLKDPAWVETNLPAVSALIWVAGTDEAPKESVLEPPKEEEPEESPKDAEPAPPSEPDHKDLPSLWLKPPWWTRLWRWVFGG